MPLNNEAYAALQENAALVANFRQEAAIAGLPDTTREESREGFCTGAALDWLRRCMVRQPNHETGAERELIGKKQEVGEFGKPAAHLNKERTARMAAAATTLRNAEADTAASMHKLATFPGFDEFLQKNGIALIKMPDGNEKYKVPEGPNEATVTKELEQWDIKVRQITSMLNTHNADPRGFAWNRSKKGSHATDKSPRGFGKMTAACGKPEFPLTPPREGTAMDETLCDMLSLNGLQPNRGILISYGVCESGKDRAHSIAVFRENENDYYLFDANVGVLRTSSPESVLRTGMALMRYVYDDHAMGGTSALGSKARWTIFQRDDAEPVAQADQSDPGLRSRLRGTKAVCTEKLNERLAQRAPGAMTAAQSAVAAAAATSTTTQPKK